MSKIEKNISIESCKLMIEDLSSYTTAFNSIEVHDKIAFANPGPDSSESLMAKMADFIVSINTVELSVVYSVRENGIRVSVRSACNDLDAGRIANVALEEFGSGGGHQFMAGGFALFSDNDLSKDQLIAKIKDGFIKNLI